MIFPNKTYSLGGNMIRKKWSLLYDRKFAFMEWTQPDKSMLRDAINGIPLTHITLLCKNMLCLECDCTNCSDIASESLLYGLCSKYGVFLDPCGSYAEGSQLPTFYVKNTSTGAITICKSDFDFMVYDNCYMFPVGFEKENGSNNMYIGGFIETDHTRPGYLRLRTLKGEYIRNESVEHHFRIGAKWVERISFIRNILQIAPQTTSIFKGCHGDCDIVYYYPCKEWPPQASTWIDRKRRSNWPTKETIGRIVKEGCALVLKAHPMSRNEHVEFRFSFSFVEKILFETITPDQRQCFVAFKSLMKHVVCTLEVELSKELEINTYHFKTIFLWACESIPDNEWKTPRGWANCFLYLITQFQMCIETSLLPSYFIPDCNLLGEIDPSDIFNKFKKEIERVRLCPLKYTAKLCDSIR